MANRHQIALHGCRPLPLSDYLKGLGLLRVVSDADPEASAAWQGECLVIESSLTAEELREFLLNTYRPTPVMAPWNGGSGFYEKDNKTAPTAIAEGQATRFQPMRECLKAAEATLEGWNRSTSPKGDDKTDRKSVV